RRVPLVDDLVVARPVALGARAALDRALDVVPGNRVVACLLDGRCQGHVAFDAGSALARRHLDGAEELREELTALRVGSALLALDRAPFGVAGHGKIG